MDVMATPLLKEIFSRGDVEALRALLNDPTKPFDIDINAPLELEQAGNTPLIHAAQSGKVEMVTYLLSLNADINLINNGGQTATSALMYAHINGIRDQKEHTKCLKVLLEHNADPNTSRSLLRVACCAGCVDCVRALIAHGANVNDRGGIGLSPLIATLMAPLHFPCYPCPPTVDCLRETVQLLLDGGADVSQKSSDGRSVLMHAARFGYPPWVQALLDRGAAVNEVDPSGSSALHWAVRSHNIPIEQYRAVMDAARCVSMLIQRGANVDAVTQDGRTALMDAGRDGKFEVVRVLMNHGASINAVDAEGRTTLMDVVQADRHQAQKKLKLLSILDLLFAHNANLNSQTTTSGSTALMEAAGTEFHEVVCRLIGTGADIHLKNDEGGTALHIACITLHCSVTSAVKCVDALVNACTDINLQRTSDGATPLMLACVRGQQCAIAKRLLQLGAKVDIRDKSNRTAMNVAIEYHYQYSAVKPELIADVLFHSKEVGCLRSHMRQIPDVQHVLQLLPRMYYLLLMDGCDRAVVDIPAVSVAELAALNPGTRLQIEGLALTVATEVVNPDHILKYLFNKWIAREICTFMEPM